VTCAAREPERLPRSMSSEISMQWVAICDISSKLQIGLSSMIERRRIPTMRVLHSPLLQPARGLLGCLPFERIIHRPPSEPSALFSAFPLDVWPHWTSTGPGRCQPRKSSWTTCSCLRPGSRRPKTTLPSSSPRGRLPRPRQTRHEQPRRADARATSGHRGARGGDAAERGEGRRGFGSSGSADRNLWNRAGQSDPRDPPVERRAVIPNNHRLVRSRRQVSRIAGALPPAIIDSPCGRGGGSTEPTHDSSARGFPRGSPAPRPSPYGARPGRHAPSPSMPADPPSARLSPSFPPVSLSPTTRLSVCRGRRPRSRRGDPPGTCRPPRR